MFFRRILPVFLAALFVAGLSQKAVAVPIVILEGTSTVLGIKHLDVLGIKYNVTFNNFPNSTFIGDTAGATAARDAINAALNMTTAELVRILNTGVDANNFGVQDTVNTTVRGVRFFSRAAWESTTQYTRPLYAPLAQFVAVPEPATLTLWLVVLGLVGFTVLRRGLSAKAVPTH